MIKKWEHIRIHPIVGLHKTGPQLRAFLMQISAAVSLNQRYTCLRLQEFKRHTGRQFQHLHALG